MATTSSFTEGASVFGGQANLVEAINNIFTIYDPEVIAVHTTCLSEVIGDDLTQIINKAQTDGKIPKGKRVIHANTPSFKGSHVTGFASMTQSMVHYLSECTGKRIKQINVIPGFVEPSDMSEMKRIAAEMGIRYIMFPDTSGVVNGPLDGKFHMYPNGGATVGADRERGRQHIHRRPRTDGIPGCGEASRYEMQGPLRGTRSPYRAAGHRRLHR